MSLQPTEVAPSRAPVRRRSTIAAGVVAVGIVGMAGAVAAAVMASGHDGQKGTTDSPASQRPTSESTAPATPSPTNGIDTGAWYAITNTNSGQCVDATNAGTSNGTTVQQWSCGNAQANQAWKFIPTSDGYHAVINRNAPSLALDVAGGPSATANGTPIQLRTYGGVINQLWKPVPLGDGKCEFIAKNSGSCPDVTNQSTSNGTQLQQWQCTTNDGAQTFTLNQRF
ncbi:RICIN domain-containing protein [Streptantibioticus ferralitis]|uniref:RICIN domain-containing protein n=1 Tax=Streptantibioticus ferralitis TaxID=236510 RepID=A0ABT5YSZ0_9ACTN|nr:RICIN domain-containing protein [Streptantibioticus ferralitis]MDF2254722.1 RICIN domain-containing protein [Streptantibioticus ferralitis]